MTTLIAVIIAVIMDRYVQILPTGQFFTSVRSTAWLNAYLVKCINVLEKLSIKQPHLSILSMVLPLCIALFIVKLLFGILLSSLGTLIFIALSLFYFLGNRAKENDSSAFVVTHEQSFGVLFWFAVLGPTGAFLYWFLVVSKQAPIIQEPINDSLAKALIWVHAMAAWIPARITGFVYALVGNFDPGFKCWLVCVKDPKLPSSKVLQDCGQAAAGSGEGEDQSLVLRAFIAWVVLIIVVVYL